MGYWKFEHETVAKPEVLKMAVALGLDRAGVIGRLALVWSWFSEHTNDGVADMSPTCLDQIADKDGFCRAMVGVGWLREVDGRLEMPHFDRFLGSRKLARQRLQQRKNRLLGGKKAIVGPGEDVADMSPTSSRQTSDKRTPRLKTEDSRLKKENHSASLRSAGADPAKPGSPPPVNGHQGTLVPPEPEPARRPRKEASGSHAECIRGWNRLWEGTHASPFAWDAKHAAAMAACLKKAEGLPERVLERAKGLLYDPPDAWTAQNASPALLASRWNELGQRVTRQSKLHQAVKRITTEEVLS